MFNISTLKTALFGMVGLHDTADPDLPVNTLTAASESVYFDDYHPLITFDNLYAISPNYDGMNYANWYATGYASGSYAIYDNIAYRAQRTILTGTVVPSLTSTIWQTPAKDWITEKQNASINKLCNQMITNKKLNESTKTFLDSVQVVDGAGRIEDTITASSRFVGFEIDLKRSNNIKAVLNYIGLQFTSIQTDLTIYLYHSSQKTAVGTWVLTSASAESFDWIDASSPDTGVNSMHYVNYATNIDSGGRYYLGYYEADITGSAIEKDVGCDCSGSATVIKWSKWASIKPFAVESTHLDGTNIFDIDHIGYGDTNYGLNFSFSIESDITEMLVNKKALFVNALGYQFANDMLQEMIYNPNSRINKKQDTSTRNAVLYEWSAPDNQNSIKNQLAEAIDALGFDLSRISQILPDVEGRRKIKMGTI